MNKKFDAVKFQREQRERISGIISKMSHAETVAFFEKSAKEYYSEKARRNKRRTRAKV